MVVRSLSVPKKVVIVEEVTGVEEGEVRGHSNVSVKEKVMRITRGKRNSLYKLCAAFQTNTEIVKKIDRMKPLVLFG
jgi:hypothetical protein